MINNIYDIGDWIRSLSWPSGSSSGGSLSLIWWIVILPIILLLIVLVGVYLFKRWLGPFAVKMDPETLYFLSCLGQPIGYLVHSDDFYANGEGDLLPIDDEMPLWNKVRRSIKIGAYEIILGWPLFYLTKNSPDGKLPEIIPTNESDRKLPGKLSVRWFSPEITELQGELANILGSRSRDVTVRVKRRLLNPYAIYYGSTATNWEEVFEARIKEVIQNVLQNLTEDQVETHLILEKTIKAALVVGYLLESMLSSDPHEASQMLDDLNAAYGNRRPAEQIVAELKIEIGNVDLVQKKRPLAEERAAQIAREGKETVDVYKQRLVVEGDFVERLVKFDEKSAADIIRSWALKSGGVGAGGGAEKEILIGSASQSGKKGGNP